MNPPDAITGGSGAEERGPAAYFCQVSETVSCGACCGLYNVPALSRDSLLERLARRTAGFAATPRTETAIEAFRRHTEGWTPEDRPFPQFHHCPYLGLVGAGRSRVGCLLHPQAPGNRGRDWRHLSYYGAEACRTYWCPAARKLPARYLGIVRLCMDDWYAYGLTITEHRLLRALFQTLEERLERPLAAAEAALPGVLEPLGALLAIKQSWPYRRGDGPGLCHFPFDNGLYDRPALRWPSRTRPAAGYRLLLRELESDFSSEAEMRAGVRWVDKRLEVLVARLKAEETRAAAVCGERNSRPS